MQAKIKNIYYMLAYAYSSLNENGFQKLEAEEFENVYDLCSAILVIGVSKQIKRGLVREYVDHTEILSGVKGKISISESIKTQSIMCNQLVCSFDEFSEDFTMNQILKETMVRLLKVDIPKTRKKELKKLLLHFDGVSRIDLKQVDWNLHYNRNNQMYQMLISICYLLHKGLLQKQSADGKMKVLDIFDEQRMSRLYEKFILEYYKREYAHISGLKVSASQVKWQLDPEDSKELLPIMQTDIYLEYQNKILIIDAKYYAHTMQNQYGANSLHSSNLYQIFTYVQNKAYEVRSENKTVSGMLLYAATDEDVQPDNVYHICGNEISARSLDLDREFCDIKKVLDELINRWMNSELLKL